MKRLKELKPQQVKKIFDTAAIIIAVLVAVGCLANIVPVCILSIALMALLVVFNIVFYRCPNCGRHLGRDGGDYCRHCGKKF